MSLTYILFFFFNDTATTEIYTLSLHDALPILFRLRSDRRRRCRCASATRRRTLAARAPMYRRSEEHTSELQSQSNLVCRLLLEKKKKKTTNKENYKKNTDIHRESTYKTKRICA